MIKGMHRPDDAIDKAKGFFMPVQGEPRIGGSMVRLREAMHALEILWGYSEHELHYGDDPRSAYALLKALRSGDLVAHVYRKRTKISECPIIPAVCWPELPAKLPARFSEPDNPGDAVPGRAARALSAFWVSKVQSDADCRGHVGKLPVLDRKSTSAWLDVARHSRNPVQTERPLTKANTDALFRDYVASYSDQTPPTQSERWNWAKGRGITRDRLRELQKLHAPCDWSKAGRRKKDP